MKAIVLCFVLMSAVVFGQQQHAMKESIRFDPSFWKEALRLNSNQYKRMQDINQEFYDQLVSAFKEMKDDRKAFRSVFTQCWVHRNTQLWATMNARQQKKWKRITVTQEMNDE